MDLGRHGKTALIVGGASGMGLESAAMLAAEELQSKGFAASSVAVDITDEKSVAATAEEVFKAHGHVDILANCAGIAQEVGCYSITVNMVSPSATNTPLRIKREEGFRESMGEEAYAERVRKVLRMYPLRRLGEPEDIASAVVFLASERASWITGQVLSVNGGFSMP